MNAKPRPSLGVLGRKAEQICEVRVQGQKDSIFPNREAKYPLVTGSRHGSVDH